MVKKPSKSKMIELSVIAILVSGVYIAIGVALDLWLYAWFLIPLVVVFYNSDWTWPVKRLCLSPFLYVIIGIASNGWGWWELGVIIFPWCYSRAGRRLG